MKITALEEYGLRCMLTLARQWPDKSITMPEISAKEGLSIPYIGKLLMLLKQAGLVKALRGRNGGYILAHSPTALKLNVILEALGEPIYTQNHCLKYSGDVEQCVHTGDCNVRHMWWSFGQFIDSILNKLTLADMLNGNYGKLIQEIARIEEETTNNSEAGAELSNFQSPETSSDKKTAT